MIWKNASFLFISALIAGCSNTPECGSSDAKDGVPEIAKQNNLYLDNIFGPGYLKRSTDLLPSTHRGDKNRIDELENTLEQIRIEHEKAISKCMDLGTPGTHWTINRVICATGSDSETKTVPPGLEAQADYYKRIVLPLEEKSKNLREEYNALSDKFKKEELDNVKNTQQDWLENAKNAKYSIGNIIPLSKDQTTGAVTCKADMKVEVNNWGYVTANIKYKLEKNTDGQIVATIF